MTSAVDIRFKIGQLNRLDPERASFDAIKRIFSSITDGMRVTVGTTSSAELFFRGRVNPGTKPLHVKELGAPPAALVTGFQRCNAPGKPMFYAASKRITALLECDVSTGDRVYLSQWIGREPFPVNKLLHNEGLAGKDYVFGDKENILHPYFDTIFTRRIHEAFSNDYKFTAAASEMLTVGFKEEVKRSIRSDGFVGLKYPSVADIENGHNTVLHPSFAEERLELLHVMELVVEERAGRDVRIRIQDNALDFSEGNIHWTGNSNSGPAPRPDDRSVPFVFSGKRWNLVVNDGEVTADYLMQLLDE